MSGAGSGSATGTGTSGGEVAGALRIRLDLAYDGSGFSGWAAQPGLRTVEGVLTQALTTVLRAPVRLGVAGRTDAGVHAAAQVAHVDVPVEAWAALPGRSGRSSEQALLSRVEGVLARQAQQAWGSRKGARPVSRQPGRTAVSRVQGRQDRKTQGQDEGRDSRDRRGRGAQYPADGAQYPADPVAVVRVPRGASDLVVTRVTQAPPGFDARFSALWRRYTYRICDALGARDPRRRGHVLWSRDVLDVEAMEASMVPLLGEHDFLSFCRPRQGATTVRRLEEVRWQRVPQAQGADAGLVTLSVVADAFCHSMVRSLVGASLEVGLGRRPVTWPARLLERRSRAEAAPVAPPHGLTLEEVAYPPAAKMAAQARRARVRRGAC